MLVYAGGEARISVTSTEMAQNNSEISFKRLPWEIDATAIGWLCEFN